MSAAPLDLLHGPELDAPVVDGEPRHLGVLDRELAQPRTGEVAAPRLVARGHL
jgi:hypothetical protein